MKNEKLILLTYRYCQHTLVSNVTLPELPPAKGAGAFFFQWHHTSFEPQHISWHHHWLSPDGKQILNFGKHNSDSWLRFPGSTLFQISENAQEIFCFSPPVIPEETIRHFLLDQVLPRCLAHQGKIMLHASAVIVEEGIILFIGDSGAGKSTLAGNFHQAGHTAISDDCVWLKEDGDRIVAIPTYGGLRLWGDSLEVLFAPAQETHSMAHYSTKKRVALKGDDALQTGESIPVLAVIMLSPPDQDAATEVALERLPNRKAFIAMLKQTFQLDLTDLERMTRHAQALGGIIPGLPAFRLSMPRNYDLLPAAREKIIQAVLP